MALSNAFLEIEITETHRETLEETKLEEIRLDLSSMLYSTDGVEVSLKIPLLI